MREGPVCDISLCQQYVSTRDSWHTWLREFDALLLVLLLVRVEGAVAGEDVEAMMAHRVGDAPCGRRGV